MDCEQVPLLNVHQPWQVFFLLCTFIVSEYGYIILRFPTPQHQPYVAYHMHPVPYKQVWNGGYKGIDAEVDVDGVCVVCVCMCTCVVTYVHECESLCAHMHVCVLWGIFFILNSILFLMGQI